MKAFKSSISGIKEYTFNMGHNKFAAQFTQSRNNVANFLQHMAINEGYLVAESIRTRKQQMIELPPPVDKADPDAANLKIVCTEEVKSVAKHRQKLEESLKKGYTMVYSQCSKEVRAKLKASDDWDKIQKAQSHHELIAKVEKICVGFNNHKQEVFNLVQLLKTLFLYTQSKKDTMEDYGRNFRSLCNMVKAFGALPGVHKGLVDVALKTVAGAPTAVQKTATEETTSKAVKAALIISGADRRKYGKLKDELANNYLLGTNQYPDIFEKALRILGNYQTTRTRLPFKPSLNDTGVAFLQQ